MKGWTGIIIGAEKSADRWRKKSYLNGLCWAAEGPHMLFHLGAGAGGLQEFCNRYGDRFHRWWDDLGDAKLTPELAEKLMQGVENEGGDKAVAELATKRDGLVTGILQATLPLRKG